MSSLKNNLSILSRKQIVDFDNNGFLVVDSLIDTTEVEALREAYDAIIEKSISADGDRLLGNITRQVMYPHKSHDLFRKNRAIDAAIEISRQLFESDAFLGFDMLIYKAPGHIHATPWHQDAAYGGRPTAPAGSAISLNNIQFWIALDSVDEENGCMHFLPGYHKKPLIEHMVASGDPDDENRLLAFADQKNQIDTNKVFIAPIQPGGATIHSYGTPHYTSPNKSTDRPRRAYIININKDTGEAARYAAKKGLEIGPRNEFPDTWERKNNI